MPDEEDLVEPTATAKDWIDWVRENDVPRVREFAIHAGIPWQEGDR